MSDRDRRVGTTGARFGRMAREDVSDDRPARPTAPTDAAPAASPPEVALDPMPAGARFGGSRKDRKAREAALAAAKAEAEAAAEEAARVEAAARAEAERIAAYQQGQAETARQAPAEAAVESSDSFRVRPYIHTGGRTRSRLPLPMESLVTASRGTSPLALQDSHRAVFDLCRHTQSVAEVSARLGIPLGVARVLIDDLAAANAVTVYGAVSDDSPDMMLMERVLAGLRRL